jgi:hypothetical protein
MRAHRNAGSCQTVSRSLGNGSMSYAMGTARQQVMRALEREIAVLRLSTDDEDEHFLDLIREDLEGTAFCLPTHSESEMHRKVRDLGRPAMADAPRSDKLIRIAAAALLLAELEDNADVQTPSNAMSRLTQH